MRLPALFVEVARACPSYGGWFGSIGDDFASHNHIVAINRGFRAERVPERYVLMNHGHDGAFDAWDREAEPRACGELPIVCFNYDVARRQLDGLRAYAASFAEYIDALVRYSAVRCPVTGLRRRAKRVLAEHGGPGVA